MDQRVVFVTVLVLAFAGFGIYDQFLAERVVESEELENGAEIRTVQIQKLDGRSGERNDIRYTWNGRKYTSFFIPSLRPALDWIRDSTSEDATIASWWDYGHSIRGYTGRDTIAYTPSTWADEHTTAGEAWDTGRMGEYTDGDTLQDLAAIFVEPPATTERLMADYDASHLLVTRVDIGKYAAISQVYNRDETQSSGIQFMSCKQRGENDARCKTTQQDNTTYITYFGRNSWIAIPVTTNGDTYQIDGTIQYQQDDGITRVLPCSRRITGETLQNGLPGCIALHPFNQPQRAVYVPKDAVNTTFTQLLFTDALDDEWTQVYADSYAQIWKPPK